MKEEITFINFRKEHEVELIQLWRKSLHQAIGLEEDTREEVVKEHLEYLQTYDPDIIRVALKKNQNKIIGFMAKEGNYIKDLFIDVEYQRKGLGSLFINEAKEEDEFLWLHTLELNKGAQKFWESHDFVIVKRGFTSFESNPWATSKEQLSDITYEWRKH
mgnify:FL=1